MRHSDAIKTTMVAMVTMTITLIITSPQAVDAESIALPPNPQPSLTVDGVDLALELKGRQLQKGELPIARIHAANPTGRAARISAKLSMLATAPSSPYARMISMPQEKWSKDCLIVVAPGQETTLDIQVDTPLPEKNQGQLVLTIGKQRLASAAFGTRVDTTLAAIY